HERVHPSHPQGGSDAGRGRRFREGRIASPGISVAGLAPREHIETVIETVTVSLPERQTSEPRFQLLSGASAFMPELAADARGCCSRLWVQFSTFEGDQSGGALAELMLERARAGVDVRFLVDHYSDAIANDILPTSFARRAELRAERRRTDALLARLAHG